MLRALTIQHFAIIDQAELEFSAGFGVITGETGAGKSILVDALSLVVGGRADASMVAHGQDRADISAEFLIGPGSPAHQWLIDQALQEDEGVVLIRRSISSSGGSRGWINGHPASASQLKDLGNHLLEIHGQHAHQQLTSAEHQRALVDAHCPKAERSAVEQAFDDWRRAQAELAQFDQAVGDATQLELLTFQVKELNALALRPGEYETLEADQERLQRYSEIQRAIGAAASLLDQDDGPSARALLRQASLAIGPVSQLDKRLENITALIDEALIQISEASAELEHLASLPEEEPEKLALINARLASALELARKHRIRPEALTDLTESLNQRLEAIQGQDEHRQKLAQTLERALKKWQSSCGVLSQSRRQAAQRLATETTEALTQLGMNHAKLVIEVQAHPERAPTSQGFDEINILFSANPGQPAKALSKVASGGELSRISLALMLAAGDRSAPLTRVFDEVDAGIGGETAHAVGRFLHRVGHSDEEQAQALCVTHLAQVAARADLHLQVSKAQAQSTAVSVRALNKDERVQEIARMLGNAQSQKSLAHAQELLELGASDP